MSYSIIYDFVLFQLWFCVHSLHIVPEFSHFYTVTHAILKVCVHFANTLIFYIIMMIFAY